MLSSVFAQLDKEIIFLLACVFFREGGESGLAQLLDQKAYLEEHNRKLESVTSSRRNGVCHMTSHDLAGCLWRRYRRG